MGGGGGGSPPVIVCIADDEARQRKEEIDSQIAVIDWLVRFHVIIRFQQMEGHHQHGSHAAQPVKDFVTRF